MNYADIAKTGFSTLGTYAATGGPGSAAIAAFAGGPVGVAVGAGIAAFAYASSEIGKGRREADIIVPLQNQYGAVLAAVNQTMLDPSLTADQLVALQRTVATGYAEFDQFTRDPRFVDGRASSQARDTIRPLVDGKNGNGDDVRSDGGTLGNLQRRIDALGGGGLFATAGAGSAAGSGGLMMWGGGLLLLAKLLKIF